MHRRRIGTDAWLFSTHLLLAAACATTSVAQDVAPNAPSNSATNDLAPFPVDDGSNAAGAPSNGVATQETSAENSVVPAETRRLTLIIGQSKSVMLPDLIRRVQVDNPAMIEPRVNKSNPKELFVTATALKPGAAQLLVTDKSQRVHRFDITITADAGPLQQAIEDMFPHTNVRAIPAGETGVAVVGYVDNPQEINAILDLADKFYPGAVVNGLKAVGPQQVQLKLMIAEVNRTKLRALGFNFLTSRIDATTGRGTYFDSLIGGLVSETVNTSSGIGLGFNFSPDNTILFGRLGTQQEFRGFLRALKQEGLAKIIAETTLVTFSGRAASMVVGGEFPIIVPGQQGTFTVEFREYGNRLEFVPIVLGGGRIRLEFRPELSQLDYANGVVMTGFTIPGIIQRRIDTSLELNTGETFVAAGLISSSVSATTNKTPYLGDMPLIGAAFRTVTYSEEEKELIIMATPELVEPLNPSQKPCAYPGSESTHPSNGELFWNGNIEAPACNPCEMTRRTELNLPVNHARTKLPCVPLHATAAETSEVSSGRPPAQIAPSANVDPQVAVPQAVSPPGLIGPLGYDAGR